MKRIIYFEKVYRRIGDKANDNVICYATPGGGIMTLENKLFKAPEVTLLKESLEGLNDVYRDIADEIGVENALAIYNLFRGTQVSFPSRLFSKDYIHKAIISEYNGNNVPQLAQKYNYSERSVWRILKAKK